jgi:hypothetical protein
MGRPNIRKIELTAPAGATNRRRSERTLQRGIDDAQHQRADRDDRERKQRPDADEFAD